MKAILDTGPWVALIDRSETRHDECVQWLKDFSGKLYSTEAVLTEVLYLLNFSIKAQIAAIDFILESIVEMVPSDLQSLQRSRTLMTKYSDLPMDYADATIVCLALESQIRNIVTFDEKDFTIYSLPGKKKFNIVP
jgi:predicted nucleic acid-binding protein